MSAVHAGCWKGVGGMRAELGGCRWGESGVQVGCHELCSVQGRLQCPVVLVGS